MNAPKPQHRTEAEKPEETRHLKPGELDALELGGEAEHETGRRKEHLLREAKKAADDPETPSSD
jgi:hypothetical protein